MEPDELKTSVFNQYLPLARHLAFKFARAYGIDAADLCEHAISALGLYASNWDVNNPADTPTCHGLYRRITFKLIDFKNKHQRTRVEIPFSRLEAAADHIEPAAPLSFIAALRQCLGCDAKQVLAIITDAPAEIVNDVSTKHVARARRAIRQYLKDLGWSEERINSAWKEVEVCLA